VAAAALIAAAASRGAIAAITSARPLRWIGVRSYAMYLWHWPVITITIALAAASWHFVESPILQNGIGAWLRNLRHKLAMTFTRPAAALPVAAAIVVSCVAVYGIAAPAGTATDNGVLRQVAEGERISAASQAQPVPTAAATHAAPATR